MRRGTRFSLSLVWALLCTPVLFALDVNSLKPQGYVSDFANVLDAEARSKIEDYCARVEQATGVQMALVTIPTLDGEPVEDVANSLYRKWGIGKKGKDEGVLLLLAIKDHKDRVEVGYGLEPILPDGFAGSVLREARPLLQTQQYGQAMLAAAEEIGSRVAKAKNVTLDFSLFPRERREPVRRQRGLPWPIIILGLIVLFSLFGRGGRRGGGGGGGFLTGMLLGNMMSGGSRWGGGGFGGYDSGGGGGGGFGGFGGGDSGGGGASSDW